MKIFQIVVLLVALGSLAQADNQNEQPSSFDDKDELLNSLENEDTLNNDKENPADETMQAESVPDQGTKEGPVAVEFNETTVEESAVSEEEKAVAEGAGCFRKLIRLVGGRVKNEGRLEIYHNRRWGSVCGKNFDIRDANVACRQLGYSRAMGYRPNKRNGRSRGPIYLDRLQCRGTEPSLFHCGHRAIGIHSCNHNQDVSVVCYHSGSVNMCDRRFTGNYRICLHKAKYNHRTRQICGGVLVKYARKYGTICNDNADVRDARVICRQLGYKGAGRAYTCGTRCGGAGRPIWLNNLHCRGSESLITQCPAKIWGRHNCGHNEDIGVCCSM